MGLERKRDTIRACLFPVREFRGHRRCPRRLRCWRSESPGLHEDVILPATSFGGVESTWERRARWPAETAPAGLIRLSVGVEPAADLITDIDHTLEVL